MNTDSSPDMRLVTLSCYKGHQTVPILQRDPVAGHVGAYCADCSVWVRWVPQTSVWLALEQYQAANKHAIHQAVGPVGTNPGELEWGVPSNTKHPDFDVRAAQAISALARACYDQSDTMGWHAQPRSVLELAMLIVTECAELAEWDRHGRPMSDHISSLDGGLEEFADILVRVFDHATELFTPDQLGQAFVTKVAYNRTRGFRHGGKTI